MRWEARELEEQRAASGSRACSLLGIRRAGAPESTRMRIESELSSKANHRVRGAWWGICRTQRCERYPHNRVCDEMLGGATVVCLSCWSCFWSLRARTVIDTAPVERFPIYSLFSDFGSKMPEDTIPCQIGCLVSCVRAYALPLPELLSLTQTEEEEAQTELYDAKLRAFSFSSDG